MHVQNLVKVVQKWCEIDFEGILQYTHEQKQFQIFS